MRKLINKCYRVMIRVAAVAAGVAVLFSASSLIGASVAHAATVSCTPSNVIVFPERVHIRCVETFGGIRYFATPTTDAAHVSRVLSVISTATVAGRTVIVNYDPTDTSGAAIGCQTNDCRLIGWIGFQQ